MSAITLISPVNYKDVKLKWSAITGNSNSKENHKFRESLECQVLLLGFWWFVAAALDCPWPCLDWDCLCVQFDVLASLCGPHISISGNCINSVVDNPFYEGLFHELSMPLGMDDRVTGNV